MMSYQPVVITQQDEDGYYAYIPVSDGVQTENDSLDRELPNIWAAVNHYLETISEDVVS